MNNRESTENNLKKRFGNYNTEGGRGGDFL
jgi:hypothetical protein